MASAQCSSILTARFRRVWPAFFVVLAMVTGCTSDQSHYERTIDAVRGLDLLRFRLSGLSHSECAPQPLEEIAADTALPRVRCAGSQIPARAQRRLSGLAAEIRSALVQERSVDRLRSAAVLDVVTGSTNAHLERAIARLGEARAAQPGQVDIINDLAVAHLVRAQQAHDSWDLFLALDLLQSALERDSLYVAALYNRALLLDELRLLGEADAAWKSFQAVDPASSIARVSRARLAAQSAARDSMTETTRRAALPDTVALKALITRAPQKARELAATILGDWADRYIAGDTGAAARKLSVAERLALGLRDGRRDQSTLRAVEALQTRDAAMLRSLAQAHQANHRANSYFQTGRFAEAARESEIAARTLPGQFRWWPVLLRAGLFMYRADYERADSVLLGALQAIDPALYPAQAGRAHWTRGVNLARQGRHEAALVHYRNAAECFERANEAENLAAMHFLITESSALLGRVDVSFNYLVRTLRAFQANPTSTRLHDFLLFAGRWVNERGLPHAALLLHREGLGVAQRTGRAKDPVEVLIRLSQAEARIQQYEQAEKHLAQAKRTMDTFYDSILSPRLEAELYDGESEVRLRDEPAQAISFLSVALTYFDSTRNHAGTMRTLARRSAVYRRQKALDRASQDLTRALRMVGQDLARTQDANSRASLQESAELVYDELVSLSLDAGHPDTVFALLEQARGGELSGSPGRQTGMAPRSISATLPAGKLLLTYGVTGDRLLIWSISRQGAELFTVQISSSELEQRIDRFERLLQRGTDTTSARVAASDLFKLLIKPAARHIENANELMIVPDKALQRVAFPALWDSAAGQYLIQKSIVRMLSSSSQAIDSARATAARSASDRVLLVSNPAFDVSRFPELTPLPAAAREADAIAALYTQPTVLAERQATPAELMRRLPEHSLIHFAGHTRFRSDKPDSSYLVLATDSGARASVLYAHQLAGLHLKPGALIILASCSSAGRSLARGGGFSGLSQSFMRAGARGVIGSLWDVDDEGTARLMHLLHQGLSRNLAPAVALRAAQLQMLSEGQSWLSEASVWAAFRYEGG